MLLLGMMLIVIDITGITWVLANKAVDDEGEENELQRKTAD